MDLLQSIILFNLMVYLFCYNIYLIFFLCSYVHIYDKNACSVVTFLFDYLGMWLDRLDHKKLGPVYTFKRWPLVIETPETLLMACKQVCVI